MFPCAARRLAVFQANMQPSFPDFSRMASNNGALAHEWRLFYLGGERREQHTA